MPRFVTNTNNVAEIGNVKRSKDGTFHLSERKARMGVQADAGFIVPDMGTAVKKSDGFRCVGCGFGTWFKTCSRCGGECFKETDS